MIRYRIYTENKKDLDKLISKYFDNFTIYQGTGYYEGIKEKCSIIEILSKLEYENEIIKIFALILDIKIVNEQSSVIYTYEKINVNYV